MRGNDGMVIFEWLAASSINASPETFRSLGVQGSMCRYVKDEFLMESSASGDIVGGETVTCIGTSGTSDFVPSTFSGVFGANNNLSFTLQEK